MENISILYTIASYGTTNSTIIELLKISIPVLITGAIGLIPYFTEIKREKLKILINDKLEKFKTIKLDLTEYYLEILKYFDSIQKFQDTELYDIIGNIIAKRLKFNTSNCLCSIYFSKKENEEIEKFAIELMKYEVATRNNLYSNNGKRNYKRNDNLDVNSFKSMFYEIINIIDKNINNLFDK